MRARAAADPKQFFDIDYRELVSTPIETVRRLYAHLGRPLTPEVESRMRTWLQDNQQNKYGTHRYTLEQFGLSNDVVHERFANYITEFSL
jgi:hypothetical protein